MSDAQKSEPNPPEPNPDDDAFEPGPIEGMPYKRGSEEDLAIRRVIEKYRSRERSE
jgi:hypothetical protein